MAFRIDYVVRETSNNLLRNLLLTLASVITFTVSLGIMGGALLIKDGVDNAFVQWKDDVQWIIYMKPAANKEQIEAIRKSLEDSPQVESFDFVDVNETFAEFKNIFKDQPDMSDAVSAKDLPQSFRIRPKNKNADAVVESGQAFQNRPGVYKVEFAADEVRKLESAFGDVSLIFAVLAGVLLFASFLLIMFMIQAAVFARRREIEVQRLVGATNWFIRVPFLLEGAVHAIIGWALATVSLIGLTYGWNKIFSVDDTAKTIFSSIRWTYSDVWTASGLMLATALAVGLVSSALSVGFYLKA